MAFPTGERATSDLLIEETAPREARVGQPVNYQIRVTNLRNAPLTGVVLEQRVPRTLQLTSDVPAERAASGRGNEASNGSDSADETTRKRINVGNLGPRESKTVQMTGTATQQGTIDTCLSAKYSPPTLCSVVNIVAPALSVKASGPSQSDICSDLTYVYNITNTGTGVARNVVLEETLPKEVRTMDGQQSIAAPVGDLSAGETKSVTVHLKAAEAGQIHTQAMVRSDDAGRAQAEQLTTLVQAPRLAVTVAGPKQDYLGQQITYQVTVKNQGDAAAVGTTVRLGATPGTVRFITAQNASGANLSKEQPGNGQNLGTLSPGESRTVGITFISEREGDLSLDATAEAKCAQAVTTPVSTHIMSLTASALVVTHDPDPVRVGTNVRYHIVVQNKGTGADHNVNVTATLPGSEQFVGGTGGTATKADGATITFATIPELAPKQVVSWDVMAKALRPDDAAVLQVKMTSEATQTPAIKVEPTKLYGDSADQQIKTNIAPPPPPTNPQAPPAASGGDGINK